MLDSKDGKVEPEEIDKNISETETEVTNTEVEKEKEKPVEAEDVVEVKVEVADENVSKEETEAIDTRVEEKAVEPVIEEETVKAVEVADENVSEAEAINTEVEEEKAKPVVEEEVVKAVEAVEEKVAEDAEKEESSSAVPAVTYDDLSLEELANELEKLIKNHPIQQIKTNAEAIKSAFNLGFGKLLAEKKAAFLAEGGNSIDFQFSSPVKAKYNQLLSDYKKQRDAYYSNLEKELKENLEKKLKVIEDLKSLIENADTKTMYKSFRDLQNTWRSIGGVPKTKYNDAWKTYHHHVERFYDLLHLSNDFRDLDFRNNLEEKLKLIEKAEALAEEKDINFAFKELQKLHKLWKEDIGPVAKEKREEIWRKFSDATKSIHDKRHDYYREMKSQYGEIIKVKLAVVEEINNYDFSKNTAHSDWQKSIKDIEALRQKYFDAGKLPFSKSEAVWQKFKAATKQFNQAKNVFYKQEKGSQQENLKRKVELIELAESLKDSEDWDYATNTLKKIQADWKKIGHVPRKFSDDIWKRFKAACNHYFDRYHNQKNALNKEQQEVVDKKNEFLEALNEGEYTTKESISDLMNIWNSLGRLPRSAKSVDVKFNKFIDKALGGLSIDKNEIVLLKFQNIVNGYLANNDVRKLDGEQIFIRKKIDESTREIQQLENNLSFFSNASDDNPLVKNVHKSIAQFKDGLEIWKKKLDYLRSLEY